MEYRIFEVVSFVAGCLKVAGFEVRKRCKRISALRGMKGGRSLVLMLKARRRSLVPVLLAKRKSLVSVLKAKRKSLVSVLLAAALCFSMPSAAFGAEALEAECEWEGGVCREHEWEGGVCTEHEWEEGVCTKHLCECEACAECESEEDGGREPEDDELCVEPEDNCLCREHLCECEDCAECESEEAGSMDPEIVEYSSNVLETQDSDEQTQPLIPLFSNDSMQPSIESESNDSAQAPIPLDSNATSQSMMPPESESPEEQTTGSAPNTYEEKLAMLAASGMLEGSSVAAPVPPEIEFLPGLSQELAEELEFDWDRIRVALGIGSHRPSLAKGIGLLATGPCGVTGCSCTSCSWYYSYYAYTSTQHIISINCSNCGASTGIGYGSHSFSGNTCVDCGYTKSCSHSSTHTDWVTSCYWERYCNDCGAFLGSGTTHGPYSYSEWQYYNESSHRRTYTCVYGDSGTYSETQAHSLSPQYLPHDEAQHSVVSYCSVCGSNVGTAALENHSYTYGEFTAHDDSAHARLRSCLVCGFSDTEYTAHQDVDGDGYCDDCNYLLTHFSVTVPVNLILTVSQTGQVYAATAAQIVNASTGDVRVSELTLSAENGWTIAPYSLNMADERVNAKQIGFKLNSAESVSRGSSENLAIGSGWTVSKGGSLPLSYDAVVSASTVPINEQVLTVVFVIGWA